MNNADRLNLDFDVAAHQVQVEGVSSFGRMTGRGWTAKQIEVYTNAAKARGDE